ncbi:glycerol-3-phosphate 1-O-acyltransferase PlsY [Candidatus Methylospira mobilis]|uniref:Glycerol-3-phosphate acyltransferase n=1 Tax=Candidatus Methylospira mobilis TaxID=1808979 RepID=A0A5Q0BQN1_9GAMM|nr:glycerol-3-phosphate 1-O-acyltransferase PlsY [Candidatus Methylospira mobilis]QFY44387.1 glycerol-3-phosphate 1-O-acyltransferase PlsY [Candidatus Methylospira mobilis]WNV06177.1 glycerol-3-phosphate 1-O-acyltransferase PlsY [Candidatus Methylospira mobilis]
MSTLGYSLIVPAAYLLGSLSSAVIVSRILGLPDPRSEGSKNPGATNVLRLGGKKAAAITLLGDMLKGLIPVVAAQMLGGSGELVAATGVAAFFGHLYPVFFGFKGGKGVATSLGVLAGFSWATGLSVLATWLLVAFLGRISSLSALVAASLAPVFVWLLLKDIALTLAAAILAVMLLWRHSANIKRILNGTEPKIGKK